MHDYLLNLTLMKGSGEYCISHLLAPGAHARLPIVDRIAALKIPVTFVCASRSVLFIVHAAYIYSLQTASMTGWTLRAAWPRSRTCVRRATTTARSTSFPAPDTTVRLARLFSGR
jgi:hypothetical protein